MTTVGKLMVNSVLPEEFRTDDVMDKKRADAILGAIALKYPERYRDISHAVMQLGREATYDEGTTLSLSDTRLQIDKAPMLQHVRDQTALIMGSELSDKEKSQALEGVYTQVNDEIKRQTYAAALASNNPFGLQVKSQARGNQSQLAAIMSTPGLYEDAHGRIIPTFVRRSYAEGLMPHEYWAATYGARKSVISTKFATRNAGYLGKQLGNAAVSLLVTEDDCETMGGMPVSVDDSDSIGSILAKDTDEFKAGTVIDRSVLSKLKSITDQIVVRSPITCNAKSGLCKQCVGIRESGRLPDIGDNIGINATSPLSERLAQSSLNVKHSGGMSNAKGEITYAGFPVVEQLAQVPQVFPNRAPLATMDGTVDSIKPAPQGGFNISIGNELHYVPPEQPIQVKEGDEVEAGDQLAAGIINPREVVQYKGVGEGRRYFAERMTQAFRDSNYDVNRRNVEVLARVMVNNVKADPIRGTAGSLPGEILPYNIIANQYVPRETATFTDARKAVGQYLEAPVMHYTIGTRITRKVADQLQKQHHNRIMVNPDPPSFSPEMLSLRELPQHEPDWVAQLGSNYLRTGLLRNVHRGATSDIHGEHPIPAIARGTEIGDVPEGTAGY